MFLSEFKPEATNQNLLKIKELWLY